MPTPRRLAAIAASTAVIASGLITPALVAPATAVPARPAASVAAQASRATSYRVVPATKGTFTFRARLLHQGVKASGDDTAWLPTAWQPVECGARTPALPALARLRASRVIASSGPEHGELEGVLQFRTTAAARQFVSQVTSASRRCDGVVTSGTKTRRTESRVAGAWAQGVALRSWVQIKVDGRYRTVPGADATLVVRKGNRVAVAATGAEYLGDAWRTPAVRAELLKAVNYTAKAM